MLAFTGWQLTVGDLLLVPLAVLLEGPPPAPTVTAVAGYTWLGGAGTLLAYTLWLHGLGRLPVGAMSFLPLLSPIVATALGWLALGQSLTVAQAFGFALALASIAATQTNPARGVFIPRPRSPGDGLVTALTPLVATGGQRGSWRVAMPSTASGATDGHAHRLATRGHVRARGHRLRWPPEFSHPFVKRH